MFRYQALETALFVRNRQKFAARMKPNSAAVFFSNDLVPSNADAHYTFAQNSNFYYLTGIDQEDCILFLFPDAPKPELREILFVKETNETIQIWDGWKYSKDEAKAASGITNIKYITDFESVYRALIGQYENLYLDFIEHDRAAHFAETPAHRLAYRLRREFPAHKIERAAPVLYDLRMSKEPEEIGQIQRACDLTEKAFRRALNFIRPGVYEYEVEAEYTHEFIRNGSAGHAYGPIFATGGNACVLHYNQNCKKLEDGEVILIDAAAEYGLYSSDLTRSVPVNGLFTERQRAVYNAVLRTMRFAESILQPGIQIGDHTFGYSQQVGLFMQEELLSLGLITDEDVKKQTEEKPAYRKYFPHGTSHHLGLDTHDDCNRYTPVRAGMVFTIEPGIYINEEKLGIRIENNYLVTENGLVDLMKNIPIEAADIETIMQTPVARMC